MKSFYQSNQEQPFSYVAPRPSSIIKTAALPYHPSVADGIVKLTEKSLKLYTEISKNCPLKRWKDRLVAVWGEETK